MLDEIPPNLLPVVSSPLTKPYGSVIDLDDPSHISETISISSSPGPALPYLVSDEADDEWLNVTAEELGIADLDELPNGWLEALNIGVRKRSVHSMMFFSRRRRGTGKRDCYIQVICWEMKRSVLRSANDIFKFFNREI